MSFVGRSLALTPTGLATAATTLSVGLPEIGAIISVETQGAGYLPDRRPKIPFERHIFSRLTQRQYDAMNPDISAPTQGGSGSGGAHQYDRLQAAMNLDKDAAC